MSEELQEVIDANPEWYKNLQYEDVKTFIKSNINNVTRSFVVIGYYLKYIRDKQLYALDGHSNLWEFAQAEFGISKPQASKFMSINDRFSKDGNSPILLEQYKDFSSSKLQEMLYLTDDQLEQVTVSTTVAEIREIRKPEEVVSTSKQEPVKPSYLKCESYDFTKFGKGCNGCFYDKSENNCPYDRTDYFAEIKRQEEWRIRCEVLKEMCDTLCKMRSYSLEKDSYSMDAIKSISRGDQSFSFGFGDDGAGHSKYDARFMTKENRYCVKELHWEGMWRFEAGEVDQQIWNVNGNTWRFKQHEAKKSETVNDISDDMDNQPEIVSDVDDTTESKLNFEYMNVQNKCIYNPDYLCDMPEDLKLVVGPSDECLSENEEDPTACCWNCPRRGRCEGECNSSLHRKPDPVEIVETEPDCTETVIETSESVIGDPESVIKTNVFECPCDTCGHEVQGCCDYDTKDDYCVLGDKWIPKPDPVETVEADIIQTVPEEPFTDQCETSGLKFNNWLKANGSSIADIVSIVLYDKKIPDKDNLHAQIQNSLISRLISKTEAYYSYLTSELGIEPERPKQIQPELPPLKNNDQRKEWAENYKAWGEWYYDEHIDCHYYKYDFTNGDRLVVEEYLDRPNNWNAEKQDRYYFHLLQKNKLAYGKKHTYEQKYSHDTTSMSEIVEYLKDLQKKGVQ